MLSYLVCYTMKKRTNVRVVFGKTWHEKWRFREFCEIIIVRSAKGCGQGRKGAENGFGKAVSFAGRVKSFWAESKGFLVENKLRCFIF